MYEDASDGQRYPLRTSRLVQLAGIALFIILVWSASRLGGQTGKALDAIGACLLGGLLVIFVIHVGVVIARWWSKRHPRKQIQGVALPPLFEPDPTRPYVNDDGTPKTFKEYSGLSPLVATLSFCALVAMWQTSIRTHGAISTALNAITIGTVVAYGAWCIVRDIRERLQERRDLIDSYEADPTGAFLPPGSPGAATSRPAPGGGSPAPATGMPHHADLMSESRAHRSAIVTLAMSGIGADFTLDDAVYEMNVAPLGVVHVPNGVIGIGDPFQKNPDPLRLTVPPGALPVHLSTLRRLDAYDGPELNAFVTVHVARGRRGPINALTARDGGPITSESGCVGFFDVAASAPSDQGMSLSDLLEPESTHGWWALLHDADAIHPLRDNTVRRAGTLNIRLPWSTHDENVVAVATGNDRHYTCLMSEDSRGRLLDVTFDLGAIDIWG